MGIISSSASETIAGSQKRKLEESELEDCEAMDTAEDDEGYRGDQERGSTGGTSKKYCPFDSEPHPSPVTMATHDLNFPLAGDQGVPCLLKVSIMYAHTHTLVECIYYDVVVCVVCAGVF